MAINYNLLKEAANAIPHFNGDCNKLEEFLRGMSQAKRILGKESERWITLVAKAKLTGKARESIEGLIIKDTNELGYILAGEFA